MAKRRSIGNSIAPWRFLLFIGLLLGGIPILHPLFHRWALAAGWSWNFYGGEQDDW